jgi:hypothetical protein
LATVCYVTQCKLLTFTAYNMNNTIHLIQFDSGGETFIYWPDSERDRDSGLRHLRQINAPDYSVRSKTYTVDEEGKVLFEWLTLASKGRYAEEGARA